MKLFCRVPLDEVNETLNSGFDNCRSVILSSAPEIDSPDDELLVVEVPESALADYEVLAGREWEVPPEVLNSCASVQRAADEDIDDACTERLRRDVREICELLKG